MLFKENKMSRYVLVYMINPWNLEWEYIYFHFFPMKIIHRMDESDLFIAYCWLVTLNTLIQEVIVII